MKRIIVWIDSEDQDAKQICKRLKRFLNSSKLSHTIVDIHEIKSPENEK